MKKLAISLLTMGIVLSCLSQGGYVYAAENGEGFFESFISKIAAIFGFSKSGGSSASVESKKQKKQTTNNPSITPPADMLSGTPPPFPSGAAGKGRQEDRLTEAVKDGKITEAQKTAILSKLVEVRKSNDPETMKDMTDDERKTAMEKQQTELKTWATEQGIDVQYVLMGLGGGNPQGQRPNGGQNGAGGPPNQ